MLKIKISCCFFLFWFLNFQLFVYQLFYFVVRLYFICWCLRFNSPFFINLGSRWLLQQTKEIFHIVFLSFLWLFWKFRGQILCYQLNFKVDQFMPWVLTHRSVKAPKDVLSRLKSCLFHCYWLDVFVELRVDLCDKVICSFLIFAHDWLTLLHLKPLELLQWLV